MAGSTKACLFCGSTGVKLPKEHAYPRWLERALNIQGTITYSGGQPTERTGHKLDLEVRDVCRDCNGGWMHDLEHAFRAVMIRPLNGFGPVTLHQPEQKVIALWAVKTWFMLERALPHLRADKAIEAQPHLFRYLFENGEPPPNAQVWLGAVNARPANLVSFVATRWVGEPPNPPVGIAGIFSVGCVLFWVYFPVTKWGALTLDQYALGLPEAFQPFFLEIWPEKIEEISWPPPSVFSADALPRTWPDGGYIHAMEAP